MSTLPAPCLGCGGLAQLRKGYCEHCTNPNDRHPDNRRGRDRSSKGRGAHWIKLSKQARRMQPWCSDCGSRRDLTTDHLPSAWHKINNRQPVTLADVDVVCRACNSRRGPAVPGSDRYRRWTEQTRESRAPGGIPSEKVGLRPRRFSPNPVGSVGREILS